jgi:hypothetical protein
MYEDGGIDLVTFGGRCRRVVYMSLNLASYPTAYPLNRHVEWLLNEQLLINGFGILSFLGKRMYLGLDSQQSSEI